MRRLRTERQHAGRRVIAFDESTRRTERGGLAGRQDELWVNDEDDDDVECCKFNEDTESLDVTNSSFVHSSCRPI